MWIQPFGAPRVIESDQEGGLILDEAKCFLGQVGTASVENGGGANARVVEKDRDMPHLSSCPSASCRRRS
eukprot:7519331-Prorocentrum_lima.AAC.1